MEALATAKPLRSSLRTEKGGINSAAPTIFVLPLGSLPAADQHRHALRL